jgi:hypothetical protein
VARPHLDAVGNLSDPPWWNDKISLDQKLFPVPFTSKDIVAFGYTHQPFTWASDLLCLS